MRLCDGTRMRLCDVPVFQQGSPHHEALAVVLHGHRPESAAARLAKELVLFDAAGRVGQDVGLNIALALVDGDLVAMEFGGLHLPLAFRSQTHSASTHNLANVACILGAMRAVAGKNGLRLTRHCKLDTPAKTRPSKCGHYETLFGYVTLHVLTLLPYVHVYL